MKINFLLIENVFFREKELDDHLSKFFSRSWDAEGFGTMESKGWWEVRNEDCSNESFPRQ